jgi:hypothetical protein
MKRFNLTIAAALVCAAFGAGAFAQDKPAPSRKATDKTQVQPSKQEAQQAEPSNENMDANAQRAHDRNTGTTPRSGSKQQQQPQVSARDVRNWQTIDKNHDNLISPEEMEAELQQKGPSKDMTKP